MSLPAKYNQTFIESVKENKKAYNDAQAYGIKIAPVADPGQAHWRVIGLHHLTGAENHGQHHVFCDVLDENGQRLNGTNITILTNGQSRGTMTIDKPANEPGTNTHMHWNDTLTIYIEREGLPSDQVEGFHTRHEDEEEGTTRGHHSFYVVFQKTPGLTFQPPVQPPVSEPERPPITEDEPAPADSELVRLLWTTGKPQILPISRHTKFYQTAQEHNLGERLTDEYEVQYRHQTYLAQIFEAGLVYVPLGQWDQIQVVPSSPTRDLADSEAATAATVDLASHTAGKVKVGIHFSNKLWKAPSEEDFELLRLAKPTCIKTCLFPNPQFDQVAIHQRLKAEHPDALIVARLFAGMGDTAWPAHQFVDDFQVQIEAARAYVTWFEVHNEPNIDPAQAGYNEGFGPTDQDFQNFQDWIEKVLTGLRANHPWARWVFPGNAIHRYYDFWLALRNTIEKFDAWGVHCYWEQDHHVDPVFGRCYERANELMPNKPLIITECGDSTPHRSPIDKIPIYRDWFRQLSDCSYIMGTALYILGGTTDWSTREDGRNFDVPRQMAEALGELNAPTPRSLDRLPLPHAWPMLTDGFDFPVGKPDGQGYYVAAGLVAPSYYEQHQVWHTGEDWNSWAGGDSDLGAPVYAVANGRVVTSRAFPNWGNIILIEHRLPWGQTVWSQYAHLKQRFVRKGDVVRRGKQIGTIGRGDQDKYPAHLHFEIRLKRLPVSKGGWQAPEDRERVLRAYAHPTNFINSNRPR